jgi:hypothetical protein
LALRLLGLLLSLSLAGCATIRTQPPERPASVSSTEIPLVTLAGPLIVRDLRKPGGAAQRVDLQIILGRLDAVSELFPFRIDVYGPFSVAVASVAWGGQKLSWVNWRQKRAGVASEIEGALAQIMPLDIMTSDILALVERRPPNPRRWNCATSAEWAWDCRLRTDGKQSLRFRTEKSAGSEKVVYEIRLDSAEADLALRPVPTKVQPVSPFVIEIPAQWLGRSN